MTDLSDFPIVKNPNRPIFLQSVTLFLCTSDRDELTHNAFSGLKTGKRFDDLQIHFSRYCALCTHDLVEDKKGPCFKQMLSLDLYIVLELILARDSKNAIFTTVYLFLSNTT